MDLAALESEERRGVSVKPLQATARRRAAVCGEKEWKEIRELEMGCVVGGRVSEL